MPGPSRSGLWYCWPFSLSLGSVPRFRPRRGGFDISRHPAVEDLAVAGRGATLKLKFSKTRQAAHQGLLIPLAMATSLPCPVALAHELVGRARRLALPPFSPLFAAIAQGSHAASSLSQSQARSFLRSCLTQLGLPPTAFSFHSFRRGGCSFAFRQGAAESDLALHGDWRSDAVRSYYPAFEARSRVANLLATAPLPTN